MGNVINSEELPGETQVMRATDKTEAGNKARFRAELTGQMQLTAIQGRVQWGVGSMKEANLKRKKMSSLPWLSDGFDKGERWRIECRGCRTSSPAPSHITLQGFALPVVTITAPCARGHFPHSEAGLAWHYISRGSLQKQLQM